MSTSNRALLSEAAAASLVVVLVTWLSSPTDPGVPGLGVHPAWLPVTLFAARYGVRGLMVSLMMTTGALAVAALLTAHHATLVERAHNPSDVLALVTAVAAAWIGMTHGSRERRVARRLERAEEELAHANASVEAFTTNIGVLRARCDRIDTSISVWRRLSNRLERGTAEEAAHAALELGALRCGATAGVVQVYPAGESPRIVGRLGAWRPELPRPRNLEGDLTVATAAHLGKVSCADQVEGAAQTDSDVAVPVLDERDGSLLGVIALRGIGPAELRAAELRDLELVADWLSAPLQRCSARPRLRAVHEEMSR